ncbi:hypothetical protein D3C72_2508360 [compost metagenome]
MIRCLQWRDIARTGFPGVLPRNGNVACARPDAVIVARQADISQLEFAERID